MPYATEWEQHGILWRYWGQVDGQQLIRSNLDIYGDERFDRLKYQIVDLTRVARLDVARDDILTLAAYDRAASLSNPRIRIAVVALLTAARSLTRLYEVENTASPWSTRLFDNMREARDWVGFPLPAFAE